MQIIAPTLVLFGIIGCGDGSPSSSTVQAENATQADQPPPPPADIDVEMPTLPEGDALEVDTSGSKIEFTGAKVTGKHDGGFSAFTGTVVQKGDEVIGTKFVIDLTTTTTDHPKVTEHLKSKDFFHVERHPSATFVSSELVAATESGAVTHNVKGVLGLNGKTRPLSFPATILLGEAATTVEASFDINRQNWGVSYPGKPDNLIKDDVQVRLSLRFPTGAADVGAEQELEAPPAE